MEFAAGTEKRVGIVTGASAGLGAEFAKQLEQHFYVDEIWLIARRKEPMQDISASLVRAEGVCLQLDLTKAEDLSSLEARLKSERPNVVVLVNNAGFGKIGKFSDIDRSAQLQCIDLNVRSLVELTHITLPFMQRHSHLIQVGSSIAWAAAKNFAVYSATKAFVLNFTRALRSELIERGIQVINVCPGPVKTEFFEVAQNPNSTGKLNEGEEPPVAVEQRHAFLAAEPRAVVNLAYRDSKAGRELSIYGTPIKIFVFLASILPAAWITRLASRK